jgi:hypothetical protein
MFDNQINFKNKGNIYIVDYTVNSFLVLGDSLGHSSELLKLGGLWKDDLKIGSAWLFSIIRKESVENYIKTGTIKKYEYSDKDLEKFKGNKQLLINTKYRLKLAFTKDGLYSKKEIIRIIDLIIEDYIPDNLLKNYSDKFKKRLQKNYYTYNELINLIV